MSSNVSVVTPVVPPGKVVPVKRIISPTLILCAAEVVRVTVVVLLKVNVAPLIAVASGVTSKNCPSKYIIKNLSVPIATYLLPSLSTNACCFLATPTKVSVSNDCQPPTFSGSPYLNLTLSESTQRPSAPTAVSCLSIPGANLILVSILYSYAVLVFNCQPLVAPV